MELYALIIVAVAALGIVGVVSYFQYKQSLVLKDMVMNIAMFKKSSDPFHVRLLQQAVNATEEKEPEQQIDSSDGSVIPENPSDEMMANLRKNI